MGKRPLLIAVLALVLAPVIYVTAEQGASRIRVLMGGQPAAAQGGSLNSGDIIIRLSGACGSGFTEVGSLDGQFLLGTVTANSNQGGTGGANDITPAGTNTGGAVSAHTGTAVDTHASHTHDYTQVLNHTHTVNVTDPGHTHVERNNSATTGGLVGWGAQDTSTNTASTTGYSTLSATTGITAATVDPGGGVATGTTAGPSATLTHTVTQPSAHAFTQPTFTGTPFDNRPAFTRVIFCQKT